MRTDHVELRMVRDCHAWRGLIFCVVASCIPANVPTPLPDASDAGRAPWPAIVDARANEDVRPSFPDTPSGRSCVKLDFLGCLESKPTPEGRTCDQVIDNVNAFPGMHIDNKCIAAAASVAAVRKCNVKCR